MPFASPGCYLCFWPKPQKSEILNSSSLGSISLLEQLTELRRIVYLLDYWFTLKGYSSDGRFTKTKLCGKSLGVSMFSPSAAFSAFSHVHQCVSERFGAENSKRLITWLVFLASNTHPWVIRISSSHHVNINSGVVERYLLWITEDTFIPLITYKVLGALPGKGKNKYIFLIIIMMLQFATLPHSLLWSPGFHTLLITPSQPLVVHL